MCSARMDDVVGGGDLPSVLTETRCLFSSKTKLRSREEMYEVFIFRNKVPVMQ